MTLQVYEDKFFHLSNDQVSYIINVLPNGQLGHLYFGPKLTLGLDQLEALATPRSKSGGTVKFSAQDDEFSLADRMQELPVYGSTDYRQGSLALKQGQTPVYLNLQFQSYEAGQGKPRNLKVPGAFGDQADRLDLTLVDATWQVQVVLHYALFADTAAVVRWTTITNQAAQPYFLERCLSATLDLPDADYSFLHLSGNWARERQVQTQSLAQGTVSVESLRGASSHHQNPFVALVKTGTTMRHGDAYGANLIYSGNFLASAEVNEFQQTRLTTGIHPSQFEWTLDPQTSFVSPEAVLLYSDRGLNGLAQQAAAFTNHHVIAPYWQGRPRPIVLNSWEAAYFNLDPQALLKLAGLGKTIGVDCFVLDDGWFGVRDSDDSSLGDWRVDTRKFPDGLGPFAEAIHQKGLQFGLWFEPEMVFPGTEMIKQHPDWVVGPARGRRSIGRHQYVLDFANPAVVANLFDQMVKVIDETHLDYMKWDMNRDITEAYSAYLAAQGRPQGEFFHRYILGVYALYEKLLQRYPHLLIEGCAGGGGRYDLGILFYSPQIWVSDDSDAVERLKIQLGTSLAYPLSAMSNHVTKVPNDQVGRTTPLATRFNVATFGVLGYELDLTKLTAAELNALKAQTDEYRRNQQLVLTGRFEILPPTGENPNEYAWAVVNQAATEALVGFFRVLATPGQTVSDRLKLPFLDNDRQYRLVGQPTPLAGSVLRNVGVPLPVQLNGVNGDTAVFRGDYQSCLMHLIAD